MIDPSFSTMSASPGVDDGDDDLHSNPNPELWGHVTCKQNDPTPLFDNTSIPTAEQYGGDNENATKMEIGRPQRFTSRTLSQLYVNGGASTVNVHVNGFNYRELRPRINMKKETLTHKQIHPAVTMAFAKLKHSSHMATFSQLFHKIVDNHNL